MKRSYRYLLLGFVVAACVLILDQWVKQAIFQALGGRGTVLSDFVGIPFLSLRLEFNTGAAFSLLANAGGWQVPFFIGIALLAVVGLSVWLLRLPEGGCWECLGVGMVMGGALGNMLDRIMRGRVLDFIDFHVGGWHYPTFNVADVGITLGVVVLMLCLIKRSKSS